MKITSTKDKPDGKRVVTVELDVGEKLIAIKPDRFYRLAEPLQDMVLESHVLSGLSETRWYSDEQKWAGE